MAYPEYTLEDDLASFVLAPGLYYTSRLVLQRIILHKRIDWLLVCIKGKANIKVFRVEWAASAMEMSVLAASNVANLIKVTLPLNFF